MTGFHVPLWGNSLVGEYMFTVNEAVQPLNSCYPTKRKKNI